MKARAGWLRFSYMLGLLLVFLSCSMRPAPAQDEAPKALKVVTDKLPDGAVGKAYEKQIDAQGGRRPYIITAAGLPDGLAIRNFSDRISGQPTVTGAYSVVITVTDSEDPPQTASATLQLKVVAR